MFAGFDGERTTFGADVADGAAGPMAGPGARTSNVIVALCLHNSPFVSATISTMCVILEKFRATG